MSITLRVRRVHSSSKRGRIENMQIVNYAYEIRSHCIICTRCAPRYTGEHTAVPWLSADLFHIFNSTINLILKYHICSVKSTIGHVTHKIWQQLVPGDTWLPASIVIDACLVVLPTTLKSLLSSWLCNILCKLVLHVALEWQMFMYTW
jgi:hypothetical protein